MAVIFRSLLILAAAAPVAADVSDRFTRLVPIAPGTAVSVQITVGDVRVHGWDRNEVSVEIVRRAPDSQQLALIPPQVEHAAGGVVVRAVQADAGRDARLRTDVTLRVPAAVTLREVSVFEGAIELRGLRGACSARIERGDISGAGLGGAVRLETSIGNIRLTGATLDAEGGMRLRTFNGDVALGLTRAPLHARILALSMGGTVTSDIPLAMKDRWGPRFGEATLGRGEPVISIDVVNGNVALTVAAAAR